ncbi:hypothetical protein B7494_g6950 [Chlorociboria aeruginascens]|nr:hypothetical protein B7494_g6950 [Chlorociboria aeruginascens]
MGPQVEANSLSDINQIAANPPKYPRNPTEKKRPSLTLYIARVPGTRDIILTTLKPRLKNVTAEDVGHSLYYLHLETEDDALILAEEEDIKPDVTVHHKPIAVARKPLAESSKTSLDISSQNKDSESEVAIPRDLHAKPDPLPPPNAAKPPIQRKPLGPRPLISAPIPTRESSIIRKPLPGEENQPSASKQPPQDINPISKISGNSMHDPEPNISNINSILDEDESSTFSINIIRRDPSSGGQWNIGNVTGKLVADKLRVKDYKITSNNKRRYFDISIHLTTPGYGYFRNSEATYNSASNTRPGQVQHKVHPVGRDNASGNLELPITSERGFNRQLQMEGLSFWDKQHLRGLSDQSISNIRSRTRSDSDGYMRGTPEVAGADDSKGSSSLGGKGYVFESPWGGRCKFSTGLGGRSLKCKHTPPGPISADGSGSLIPSQVSANLSELRFNLPTSFLFNSLQSAVNGKGVEMDRLSIPKYGTSWKSIESLPPLPPRPHPSPCVDDERPPLPPRPVDTSDEEQSPVSPTMPRQLPIRPSYEEDRLDLSLGQEKAGGGNRGKRAKLGKLIIHDEGFKMLDLIVAANVGVWWSVWESGQQ